MKTYELQMDEEDMIRFAKKIAPHAAAIRDLEEAINAQKRVRETVNSLALDLASKTQLLDGTAKIIDMLRDWLKGQINEIENAVFQFTS